jgi:hypothetical protein
MLDMLAVLKVRQLFPLKIFFMSERTRHAYNVYAYACMCILCVWVKHYTLYYTLHHTAASE